MIDERGGPFTTARQRRVGAGPRLDASQAVNAARAVFLAQVSDKLGHVLSGPMYRLPTACSSAIRAQYSMWHSLAAACSSSTAIAAYVCGCRAAMTERMVMHQLWTIAVPDFACAEATHAQRGRAHLSEQAHGIRGKRSAPLCGTAAESNCY